MTALAIFGICMAIAIALIVTVLMVLGSGAVMLVVIFPAMIAEAITGERGMFAPNGSSGNKSIFHQIIMFVCVVLEVALIASIFFGIYCLFCGWPVTDPATEIANSLLVPAQIGRLQIINKILLAFSAYFVIMFSYSSYKFRDAFKQMKGLAFFTNRILPLISFPLVIIYLVACHYYLQSYPEATSLSLGVKVMGTLYTLYRLYSFGNTIYLLSFSLRSHLSELKFRYWFGLAQSTVYNVLFFYFFFQV